MKSVMKKVSGYFTRGELILWCSSVTLIIASFFAFGGNGALTLAASLVGVTSILFNAKGNPFAQLLMIVFSLQLAEDKGPSGRGARVTDGLPLAENIYFTPLINCLTPAGCTT